MSELDDIKRLKLIAANCADNARTWRRRFRFSAWIFVAYPVLFVPTALAFMWTGKLLPMIGGALLIGLSVLAIINARSTFREANRAYSQYMAIRQDCLDALAFIE